MNKSYSKIRHMEKSNLILEGRRLNEQHDMDDNIQWDIESVECDGSTGGHMDVNYEDDMIMVTIRYCEGDHEELKHLKKKAKHQIESENQFPNDGGFDF